MIPTKTPKICLSFESDIEDEPNFDLELDSDELDEQYETLSVAVDDSN